MNFTIQKKDNLKQ